MVCTFFGNRDTPAKVETPLRELLVSLIGKGTDTFYVGHQGNFDKMVYRQLKQLSTVYAIRYFVVLAALPKPGSPTFFTAEETVYPDGLEKVPPRFAIDRRNRWMIDKADIVITYIVTAGGASKFRDLAIRKEKTVLSLAP